MSYELFMTLFMKKITLTFVENRDIILLCIIFLMDNKKATVFCHLTLLIIKGSYRHEAEEYFCRKSKEGYTLLF